jgi:peptidoglycan LD-endopeptidase CwlK
MIYLKILAPAILFFFVIGLQASAPDKTSVIIDSNMSFEEATKGTKAPPGVLNSQRLITVRYCSTDGKLHQGQIMVHKDVADEVTAVFKIIEETKFPVEKCIPIVKYDWDDHASMEDNNTSAFNYRTIAGTDRMSNHAYGKAVDINPRWNPFTRKNGTVSPENGKYDKSRKGTFTSNQKIVQEFKKRGWRWGGEFSSYKDYHHFDKEK